jgi:hypothetical protein
MARDVAIPKRRQGVQHSTQTHGTQREKSIRQARAEILRRLLALQRYRLMVRGRQEERHRRRAEGLGGHLLNPIRREVLRNLS